MVDDDQEDFLIFGEMLTQAKGRAIELDLAPTYAAGLSMLEANHYDAALVDYDLGTHTGIELIRDLAGRGYPAPLILFTGHASYGADMAAMEAGASLFLTKGEATPSLLERSIRYAIDRKRVEAGLNHRLQERSIILESIQDGLFGIDWNWRITYTNSRAARNGSSPPRDLVGRNIWEAYPELLGTILETNYHRVMIERTPMQFEMRALSDQWYNISVYPSVEGISVYWQDITERKQAEELLRKREAQLQVSEAAMDAFFEASPGILNLFDQQLRYIKTDPTTPTYFGHDSDTIIGKSLYDLNPSFAEETLAPILKRVTESGEPELILEVPGPVPSRKGETGYWRVSYFPVPLPDGSMGLGVIGVEITDIKWAERALEDSETRFRQLADAMPQLVWTAQTDGTVDYYNQRYQDFDGIAPGSDGTWDWAPVVYPEDIQPTVDAWLHALATGQTYQIEHRIRMSDGAYRWHLSRGILVRDEHDQPVKWFGTATDIQDLKNATFVLEKYAAELERSNRDLQEFAFVASHDLQEPLRKIEAFSGLLLDNGDRLDTHQSDILDRIQKSANRMRSMVDGLLQLSRLETQAQPFRPVELNQVVKEVLSDLEMQIRRTDGAITVCDLPVIEADPLQMRRLFQNLVGNALKFQPEGAKPRVEVCTAAAEPGFVEIRVIDNGIGFDDDQARHMFEPFKRLVGKTQYDGSGMGLAICRKIVERHGGSISAHSQPEQGATFVVNLPVLQTLRGA